jgi:GxxExxY protein
MTDQTTIIREIAEDVYKTLGSGFSEDVYDRAMQVGLRLAKIGYEGQKVVELKYKEHYVGEGYPDLVVHLGNEKLIVELKAIGGELGASEEQQLRNYMTILKVQRGMLINFQATRPKARQNQTGHPRACRVNVLPIDQINRSGVTPNPKSARLCLCRG